ncbi:MAG: ribonuclease P protein component [Planctomycetota bacterium]|nr:MAG: ribonuclease P protein component [Planctomycetota bacterium]
MRRSFGTALQGISQVDAQTGLFWYLYHNGVPNHHGLARHLQHGGLSVTISTLTGLEIGRLDRRRQLGASTLKNYLFTKQQRLTTNEQFKAVLSRKCCVSNELFRLHVAANECGHPRLGVSVDRTCGCSVVRNRLKRLAREVFRCQQHHIGANIDYLLIFSAKMSKNSKSAKQHMLAGLTLQQLTESFLKSATLATKKLTASEEP